MIRKGRFTRIAASLVILLSAYFLTTVFECAALSSILSPAVSFLSAVILYFAYLKSDRTIKVNITLLLYAFGCSVWGIADISWAVLGFAGGAPEESTVLQVLYVLTNCFFMVSVLIYAVHQFRKWDLIQFCIDLCVTGLLSVVLFWILFMRKDINILKNLLASDPTSVFSIASDVLIGIGLLSLFLSIRGGKIPGFLHIISAGLFSFAVFDMLYYYLSYNGLYFPDGFSDFLYMFAFAVVAFGALWKTYKNSMVFDLSGVTNVGNRRRWVYLLLYPVVMILDVMTGFVRVELTVYDFFAVGLPIFFYWAACKYVQLALEKESLLKRSNEVLEQRVAEQVSELKFLANQDTLTTLFNRRYFTAHLEDTISGRRHSDSIALLIMDMDQFKTINDTFGHDVGDRILLELSYRLTEWNNNGAVIARLGGDEFAFLFAGKYAQKDIERFCSEITELCAIPFNIDQNTMSLTISIGAAFLTEDVPDGKSLMQNADIAMYRAKSQGYNRYLIFDSLMSQDLKRNLEIEFLLRQTDTEKDFELFYQPQFALPGKALIGAEALLRWNHPEHGYIPPNVFIPIAEQIDYISKIGKWVMQETIRQTTIWNKQYKAALKDRFQRLSEAVQGRRLYRHDKGADS